MNFISTILGNHLIVDLLFYEMKMDYKLGEMEVQVNWCVFVR